MCLGVFYSNFSTWIDLMIRKTLKLFLTTIVIIAISNAAHAEVVIFDGFGDADINNNGIPLEDVDVNVAGTAPDGEPNTYVPARLEDEDGNGPANLEVTEVLDASDTGLPWIQMRGFTSGGTGDSKPSVRIVDDSTGAMQDTADFGTPALDSGYAMSWESRGGGSSAAAFFGQNIALGPEVGDEVSVSFDFRIWRDAPNLNGGQFDNDPFFGIVNFGLFQDTDNQLGMTNPFAGPQPFDEETGELIGSERSPAVWGEEEGRFDGGLGEFGEGDDIGAQGDNGWVASVSFGDANNGQNMYIEEEVNDGRIFQGSDRQRVFENEGIDDDNDPFSPAVFDGFDLDLNEAYNLELSLTRATDLEEGDTIFAAINMTNLETGEVLTVSGLETFDDEETGGPQSDNWDYFAITNRSSGLGENDFILDNFTVEVNGSNASSCDPNTLGDLDGSGDVAFADFLVLSANFGQSVADHTGGDINCDGDVAFADFLVLSDNFGQTVGAAASVPEPTGFTLLAFAGLLLSCKRRQRD